MALINCKECGGQMSDRATECPHCGCPIEFQIEETSKPLNLQPQQHKPRKSYKLLWITLAVVGALAVFAGIFFLFGNSTFGKPTLKITPEFTKALERYDQIDAFSEGLAAVRRDGKWGYINLKGEEVIPCQFSDAFPSGQFSEGLACVVDNRNEADKKLWNKRVGFINSKGEWVLTGDYFTESPNIGSVWEEESHKLPSFKDGKCAIWNTGTQEAFDDNEIRLVDTQGAIHEVPDSVGYKLLQFQPYPCPVPYKYIASTSEKKIVYDDYAITIARDTIECDNGARLVTWQILDANSYPYQTEEKTIQYFIDNHGNSTLTSTQQEAMEQHLNGLMASLLDQHNEQQRRAVEEERQRREEEERQRQREWLYGTWEYSGTSSNNSSSYSSSNSKETRWRNQLKSLTDEHNSLLDEFRTYQHRGQLDPMNAMWYKQRLLAIKDEQTGLAQNLGDYNLVREYQQRKMQLELIFRNMGL